MSEETGICVGYLSGLKVKDGTEREGQRERGACNVFGAYSWVGFSKHKTSYVKHDKEMKGFTIY